MLKITDCPHPAGTPQHSEWVRTVFIPTVRAERTRIDRARFGAPAIGGHATDGGVLRLFVPVPAAARHVYEEHLALLSDGVVEGLRRTAGLWAHDDDAMNRVGRTPRHCATLSPEWV